MSGNPKSLAAVDLNLTIERGDSPQFNLTIMNETGVDLSGASFVLTVGTTERPSINGAPLFQVSGIADAQFATNGLVAFQIPSADTDPPAGTYFYDIRIVDTALIKTTHRGVFVFN